MEQKEINQKILDELKQIRVDINILKERLPEEDTDDEFLVQVKESLEDAKAGRIRRVA